MSLQLVVSGSTVSDVAHAMRAALAELDGAGGPAALTKQTAEAPAAEGKRGRGRPANAVESAGPATPAPAAEQIGFDQVKAAMLHVAKPRAGERTDEEGYKRVADILAKHGNGVAKIKDIPPALYGAVYHAATAVLEAAKTAPASGATGAGPFD